MASTPMPTDIATVIETNQSLEIQIPAKRNPLIVVFLSLWLCGWGVGEFAAVVLFLNHDVPETQFVFLVSWLGLWSIGGLIAIYMWLWLISGKQRIILGHSTLAVVREMIGHKRVKEYALADISNFTASPQLGATFQTSAGMRFWGLGGGPIAFIFGTKAIRVGAPLELAEAQKLCELMLRRNPSLGRRSAA